MKMDSSQLRHFWPLEQQKALPFSSSLELAEKKFVGHIPLASAEAILPDAVLVSM